MSRLLLFAPALLGLGVLLPPATPAQEQKPKGKKYALLVGITEYKHQSLAPLSYTENDVEKLADILKGKEAGYESVRVLTTTRGEKSKADAPTAANIKKALEAILDEKGRHDTVFLALSGHGIQLAVDDPDGKGKERVYAYFCPSDADLRGVSYSTGRSKTLLNMDHLFEDLGNCGAGVKLVIMDACRNEMKAEAAARSLDVRRVNIPEGVAALFSCKPGQRAFEDGQLKHGVFFHFVLEGLRGQAKNKAGQVTWSRLSEYVIEQVEADVPKRIGGGAKQTPHEIKNIPGAAPVLIGPGGEEKPVVVEPKRGSDEVSRLEVGQTWTGDSTEASRGVISPFYMVVTQVSTDRKTGKDTFAALGKQGANGRDTWFDILGEAFPEKNGKQSLELKFRDTGGNLIQLGEAVRTGKEWTGKSRLRNGTDAASFALTGKAPVKSKHGLHAGSALSGKGSHYTKQKLQHIFLVQMIVVSADDSSFEAIHVSIQGKVRQFSRVNGELKEGDKGEWRYKHRTSYLGRTGNALSTAEGTFDNGVLTGTYENDRNNSGTFTLQLAKPEKK